MSDDTQHQSATTPQQEPKPASAATTTESTAEKAGAELNEEQLGQASGGIIAVLIGL
jgi:hypothetical protein